MEPHNQLVGIEEYRPDFNAGPQEYFDKALKFARTFYAEQMDYMSSVRFENVTPELFFLEITWVIHATGFSAKAVGKFMPRLEKAYDHWTLLANEKFETAFERVKLVCNNPPKARAVHQIACHMWTNLATTRWEEYKAEYLSTPEKLQKFPYIGKITCYHLARNIGLLEFVKPDLHLVRMAKHWGFPDCVSMCKAVRPEGMPLGIIDYVFWINASVFGTIKIRAEGDR